jgi:hypothetical protein
MLRPRRRSTVRFRESLVHERRDDEEQRTLLSQADLRAESVIQADAGHGLRDSAEAAISLRSVEAISISTEPLKPPNSEATLAAGQRPTKLKTTSGYNNAWKIRGGWRRDRTADLWVMNPPL